MNSLAKIILVICIVFFLFACSENFNDEAAPSDLLHDNANLLNEKEEIEISLLLSMHNNKGPGRIRVYTISELPDSVSIEKYANESITSLINLKDGVQNQILLLIAVKDKKLLIETSKDVRDLLTDGESAHIINQIIVPAFKNKGYSEGIRSALIAMTNELEGGQKILSWKTKLLFLCLGLICLLYLLFKKRNRAMTDIKEDTNSTWLKLSGIYVLALAGAILIGALFSSGDIANNAARNYMRFSFLIVMGFILTGTGIGLIRKSNLSRRLFLVFVPWGSIALGSAFANILWSYDIPKTAFLILTYVPLSYALTRRDTLRTVGVEDYKWVGRGVRQLLFCFFSSFSFILAIKGGNLAHGNLLALMLSIFYVPMWHYVFALVVVAIPTPLKKTRDVKHS